MDIYNLSQEISNLVILKTEGDYWDFKQQWYCEGKEADLLHDIICMANNTSLHDGYIIIGVDDATYTVLGISPSDAKRKSQQNVIDFLKDKKFAGGIRPTVYVQTVGLTGAC